MTTSVIEESACLNCGETLRGPYCARCGQKKVVTDLTLRDFVHETTHELTNWDGKIPTTLKALFFKPGLLTLDFLAGRRARWLSPLRLYLICSIAYFVSGPLIEAITRRASREIARVTITNADGSTGVTPEMRRDLDNNTLARIFGVDRLERAVLNSYELNSQLATVVPKSMFLLLPMFAVLTRVMWRRTVPRYPAHLYLALHIHAAWFGAMTVFTVIAGFVPITVLTVTGVGFLGYMVWYAVLTARRVFRDLLIVYLMKS
jgi:hypothetical protein